MKGTGGEDCPLQISGRIRGKFHAAKIFRRMIHLGRTERGHVLAGGVMKVGDIKGHKELNDAYELGKALAQGNGL